MHSLDVSFAMTTAVHWKADRAAVVAVSGDLDHHTAPKLGAVLDQVCRQRPALVSVDLGAVSFFCSAAVAQLLAIRSHYPCEVRIVQAPAAVRRVMAILGLGLDLQAVAH